MNTSETNYHGSQYRNGHCGPSSRCSQIPFMVSISVSAYFIPKGWHMQPSSENYPWAAGIFCPAFLRTESTQHLQSMTAWYRTLLLKVINQFWPLEDKRSDETQRQSWQGRWRQAWPRIDSEGREMSSKVHCFTSPSQMTYGICIITKNEVSSQSHVFSETEESDRFFKFLKSHASCRPAVITIFRRSTVQRKDCRKGLLTRSGNPH